jgi:CubicO group peptidase (beta-lactamase class C family)
MPTSIFADTHLFQPLGIVNYIWPTDPHGIPDGGGISEGVRMSSRDLAKIGFLYLNNGTWDGQQIVSADWVTNSTIVQSTGGSESGYSGNYGYLWWVKPSLNLYCAFGYRGQFIFVIPSQDVVFVTTSSEMRSFEFLIKQFILPSVGVYDFMTTIVTTGSTTPTEPSDILPLVLGAGVAMSGIVVVSVIVLKRRR